MRPPNNMIPRPSARGLIWALLLVAGASLVLAKSEANRQQVVKQQEAAKQQVIAAAVAPIEAIEPQASLTSKQEAAEKKQGEQAAEASFNTEEYVQIKPEEIGGEAASKADIDPAVLALSDLSTAAASQPAPGAAAAGVQAVSQQPIAAAEHKSAADDELSAHLAHDSIGALESGSRPYATQADPRAARAYGAPSRAGPGHMQPARPYGQPSSRPPRAYGPPRPRRPAPYKPMPPPPPPGYGRAPRMPMPPGPRYPSPQRLPGTPGYISSMVPHAPRPSHYGSPAQTPGPYGQPPPRPAPATVSYPKGPMSPQPAPSRYLPRGAAAGYAAFREFVRAQASRYKGQQHSLSSHEPVAYNAAPSNYGPSYGAGQAMVEMAVGGANYREPTEQKPHYQAEPALSTSKAPQPNYSNGPEQHYSAPSTSQAPSKVTVAQAYIPHMAAPSAGHNQPPPAAGYHAPAPPQSSYGGQNPVLAKLYGGHAPQGVGRPEYSKDYGMVIHYPQATVYTEPMTVDQLHKLAGSSITHVIEHLQQNLAHGQRNEANTIRANSKHHLGHGLAIHAKEYYAPGKSGHYVPTTAAVISSHHEGESYPQAPPANQYGGEQGGYQLQHSQPQHHHQPQPQHQPELGSGYERVKAAVAASAKSAMKYGSAGGVVSKPQMGGYEQASQPAAQHSSSGGLSGLMKPYEPLGALANIIGSELESLYNKANSVLSKQIDPELHAHVQAHLKSLAKVAGPLKMSEHDHRSPLALRPQHGQSYGPQSPPQSYRGPAQYGGPQAPRMPYEPSASGRAPRRPMGYEAQAGVRHAMPNRYRSRPAAGQQQQQSYQAEQQAFQDQVNQMLSEFNLGEDNYGAKSQPIHSTNQGYPNKVIQKHQAQSYMQANPTYEHSEGLEILQGPNDQIGEISDLIESLKGTLESHKPETGATKDAKPEDVEYITSTLGQVPSYAIQVPVGQPQQHQNAGEQAVYEAVQKAEQQQHQQQPQPQPQYQPRQPHYQQQQPQQYQQQPQQQPQYQQQQHYTSQNPATYQEPHTLTIQHDVYQPQGAQVGPTLPYQAPPAPAVPASSGYESAAPVGRGYQQQQQQSSDYSQGQQQPQAYGQYSQQGAAQQEAAGYSRPAPVEAYNPQPQPASHQQAESYAPSQQQQPGPAPEYSNKAPAQDYSNNQQQQHHEQASSYEAPAQGGAYPQEQHQPASAAVEQPAHQYAQPQQQQQQASYGSTGHTQVINHLVPAQQQAAADYGSQKQAQALTAITSSISHQPVNQISVAAPTESQYQSAQPLSSFVESLPSDYQELLRQPQPHASLLESITSGSGSNQHEPLYANATTSHDIAKVHQVSSQQVAGAQHQHQRRQYDSHHLSASASSLKATYLQKPAAASSSKSAAQTSSASSAQSAASSSSVSSPSSTSASSSSSSSSSPASSSAVAAKAASASQQDS